MAPGDVLFRLDPQELEQTLVATKAMLSAATAELEVAEADVVRYRALFGKDSISQQAFEREKMAERAAKAQWESAQAQVRHAEIALRHTVLKATAPGILIDVSGNVGQVVAAGQPIALLADLNEWEIEVFLPDGFRLRQRPRLTSVTERSTSSYAKSPAPQMPPVALGECATPSKNVST
ncbi:MAG: hypothetical protein R3F38_08050 [Gammaproteobacteria bacterium]